MDFKTRYEFNPKTDLLGKGGFSKVYKANDVLLDRTVALKFFTGSGAEKYRVLNEIKKVIRFEHPNLCKYYDVAVLESQNVVGETETIEVGIMEYLDAGDFKTYLKNHPQHTDKLLIDVLSGLSYLHKKGIVHRDLKPMNIIIKMEDDGPVAKITDFGISKLLGSEDNQSSALIGTIEYMAPEQFNPRKYGIGGKITTNLDLWSFGLLIYEVLEHKPLFGSRSSGTSAEQVMQNILGDAWLVKTKSLPPKYKRIVDKCLVKYASERAQHALELIPLFQEETHLQETGPDAINDQTEPVDAEQEEAQEKRTGSFDLPGSHATNGRPAKSVQKPPPSGIARNKIILYAGIALLFVISFFVFKGLNPVQTPTGTKDSLKTGNTSAVAARPPALPEFVQIEGDSFFMGNDNEWATEAESPEHEVHLMGFSISKYEISVAEFGQFINETKYVTTAETEGTSGIYKNGKWEQAPGVNWRFDPFGQPLDTTNQKIPVVHVSWIDASKYCEWLSDKTHKRIQLPTEAEWEFAAKGGNKSRHFMYSGSDSLQAIAWSGTNAGNKLQPVGGRQPNELGIYDMSGNVMEWCNDWYNADYYKENIDNNPLGPASGKTRVVRGGSWFLQDNKFFRNTFRTGFPPKITGGQLGFRVCEVRY